MHPIKRIDQLPYDKRPRREGRPTPSEIDDFKRRMSLSLYGMPRICVLRHCRRRNKCFGPDMICARHHAGLLEERYRRDQEAEAQRASDRDER